MTISDGLKYRKSLIARQGELKDLLDSNKNNKHRLFGDRETIETPVYDVKRIDGMLQRVSRELRLLESAIQKANVSTAIDHDEDETAFEAIN